MAIEAHELALRHSIRSGDQIVVVSHRGTKTYPNMVLMRAKHDEIQTPVSATSVALQDFDFVTQSGSVTGSTFYGAVSTDASNDLIVVYATSSSVVYQTLQVTSQLSTPHRTLSPRREP